MKKLFLVAAFLFSNATFAGLIGNVEHNYGSSSIPSALANGACDVQQATHLTIKDSSGCQRFVEVFDFSDFSFDSIDYFQLDLTFSATRNDNCLWIFCEFESWHVRPALNNSFAPATNLPALIRADGITQQSFVFNASNLSSIFDQIVNNNLFYLWFAENSLGSDQFNLYSANLSIYGTPAQSAPDDANPVPAPASIALLGLGLLMLRRFKK